MPLETGIIGPVTKEVKLNKSFATVILMIALLSTFSCATAPILPPEWRYEKEAVKLSIIADPQLNLYNNTAHTLQLCIYQLKDPNGYNQLSETEEGLYKLLEGSLFDASVANFKRLNLSPGQSMPFTMDRAEGAKYIGFAAGYASVKKERITRLVDIPVIVVEQGGMFKKQRISKPDTVNLKVRLGAQQIEAVSGE